MTFRSTFLVSVSALALVAGTSVVKGQSFWNVPSGTWSSGGDWTPGGPANNGTAIIDFNFGSSSYTSTLDTNFSVASVTVLAGSNTLTLLGSTTLTVGAGGFTDSSGHAVTINPGLAGTMALVQNGSSTLTLSGTNTYSGLTSVLSGVLADGAANSFSANSLLQAGNTGVVQVNHNETVAGLNDAGGGNGSVVLASLGTVLTMNGGTTTSFSGVISGAGGLEKNGTSTLVLTGANTYTGPTLIDTGSGIDVGGGTTTGSLASDVSSTGTGGLEFDRSNAYTYAGTLSGTLNVSKFGAGTTTLSGTNTYSGPTTVGAGTLQAGSTSAFGGASLSPVTVNASGTFALNGNSNTIGSLAGAGTVALSNSTLTVANPGSITTFSGNITGGAGSSLVSDSNILELSGNNTYVGSTLVSQGTLIADNTSGSATGMGPLTIASGAVLQVGPGAQAPVGIVGNSSIAVSGTLAFTNSSNGTFAGNISGNGLLDQLGDGTLTLSGNNTFSGATQVQFGTLAAGSATAFGGSPNSSFTLVSNGVLDLTSHSNTIGSVSGDTSTLINIGSPSTFLTIAGTNMASGFMGTIQGSGGLTLTGVNAITTLSGANTYSGGTTITTGFLIADNATGSATGSGPISVSSGAILQIGNADTNGSVAATSISNSGTIEIARLGVSSLLSTITGSGGLSLLGNGTVTLGANNYAGQTFVVGGQLVASTSTSFGGTGFSPVNIIAGGTLNLNNNSNTVGSISGDSTSFINLGSASLTTGALGTSTTFGGVIEGTGSLIVVGTGVTTLDGANTYTGGTTIPGTGTTLQIGDGGTPGASIVGNVDDEGTLVYKPAFSDNITYFGNISGGGAVTFSGTGTINLAGTNTYTGLTLVNSGTLADASPNAFSAASGMEIGAGGSLMVNFADIVGDLENGAGGGPVLLAAGATLTSLGLTNIGPFTGVISGPGTININASSGSQGLGGASTYSGGTMVTSGELYFDGASTGTAGNITSGPLGTGLLTVDGGAKISPTTSNPNALLLNDIFLPGAGNDDFVDDFATMNLTLNGAITGNGGIEWCGTGVLTLTGNNSFHNGVDMRLGTLLLGTDTAAGTGTITLDSSAILSALGTGVARMIPNAIDVTGSPGQIGNNDSNFITVSGNITGSNTLVYSGGSGGTLTLTGNNNGFLSQFNVTSGTVIAGSSTALGNAGTSVNLSNGSGLNIMGGVSIANPVTFAGSPNILSGSGTISSAVMIDSHAVLSPSASPGNGPGNLTFSGPLTLATGGAISFHLFDATGAPGSGFSLFTANGGLDLTAGSNTLTFNLVSIDSSGGPAAAVNFNPFSSYSWTFATSSSAIVGFSASQFHLITSGFTNGTAGGTFSFTEVGNNLDLNFTPVPEPSTWALLGAGLLGIAPFAVKRRRAARA